MDMPNWLSAMPKNRIHSLRSYWGSRMIVSMRVAIMVDEKL